MTASTPKKFVKKKRPISRKFWNLISFLPSFIRKHIVRSKFDAEYILPSEVILKQAETEDELLQAMQLVHDSYVELGYMDPTEERLRFNKYLALPTTVILIAKWNDEVIGTISIIPDSALGLPTDTTWDLSKIRNYGRLIGEVSSLAIHSKYKMRRGKLLLPLCKLMWEYATKVYNLDALVIATTLEVEPFYTDILLFDKVTFLTGQEHSLVKGNRSTCCYILTDEAPEKYKKAYNHLSPSKNLFHFFVEYNLKNIILPKSYRSIHGQLSIKNETLISIIEKYENLTSNFDDKEKLVLTNHHVIPLENPLAPHAAKRDSKRIFVNEKAWIFINKDIAPIQCRILDVSPDGFQLITHKPTPHLNFDQRIILLLQLEDGAISCQAAIRWKRGDFRIGCQIKEEASRDWKYYITQIWRELNLPTENTADKKTA